MRFDARHKYLAALHATYRGPALFYRTRTGIKKAANFRETDDIEHAFGPESDDTFGDDGLRRQLSWWQPGKHKEAKYYTWGRIEGPRRHIWLQVSDGKRKGEKRVYIRIEAE